MSSDTTHLDASGRDRAEAAAVERLLNAYLRELGIPDPRLIPTNPALTALPRDLSSLLRAQGTPMRLTLLTTRRVLLGIITYHSPSGHHQYGSHFWVGSITGSPYRPISNTLELARLLLAEVAAKEPDVSRRETRQHILLQGIKNSIEKTTLYVERALQNQRPRLDPNAEDGFLAAEQALVFGHPFHPTPKSSAGFSHAHLEHYAPEFGASFPLHYFAASPDLVMEDFLPGMREGVVPAAIQARAFDFLGSARRNWVLLPCHPWQAHYLHRLPEATALLQEGRLCHLGSLGGPVYPTSSVRTIWDPGHSYYFKLPLNVRITNFVRTNPLDHLRRSMDASRLVHTLRRELPLANFTVLLEVGYRTVLPLAWASEGRHELSARFGVLFRETPLFTTSVASPMVLAALLETSPHDNEPVLIQVVRRAAGTRSFPLPPVLVAEWLRRYLDISLLPLLWLFVHHGISLEAHVQNTLIAFQDGWPARLYLRDLEGASISRDRARAHAFYQGQLPEDSPALYADEEAWKRLQYYFFVNHLGHLLFTLARYTGGDEGQLWQVVRTLLQQKAALFQTQAGDRYLEELLSGSTLPAKANLLSCFQERGETPLYVQIPNPINKVNKTCEVNSE